MFVFNFLLEQGAAAPLRPPASEPYSLFAALHLRTLKTPIFPLL